MPTSLKRAESERRSFPQAEEHVDKNVTGLLDGSTVTRFKRSWTASNTTQLSPDTAPSLGPYHYFNNLQCFKSNKGKLSQYEEQTTISIKFKEKYFLCSLNRIVCFIHSSFVCFLNVTSRAWLCCVTNVRVKYW